MSGSHLFNLGLHQKRFLSTSKVSSSAINIGCTRGRGSTTRMLSWCHTNSENPSLCINQFINITQSPAPEPDNNLYLYSKNNTTDDGFQVGEPINKDMYNTEYTDEFDPQDYYPAYFPGMAPFTSSNIVAGDKSSDDRLLSSEWSDWGNDIFDGWGFFYLYDVEQGKYYFPLFEPQNMGDGQIFTNVFNAFGRTFTIKQGYPVQGIFKFDISVNDNKPFIFGGYGNMGSDGDEVITHLTYPYSITSNDLTLYYVEQAELGDSNEILYTYFIPKKVSENSSKTYDLQQEPGNDNNSLLSKEVSKGLIVYFSKTNDVKEWVVNDLDID